MRGHELLPCHRVRCIMESALRGNDGNLLSNLADIRHASTGIIHDH
jgi:hypothetical protein